MMKRYYANLVIREHVICYKKTGEENSIYTVALGVMALSALVTFARADWSITEAALVSAGAMLFLISDHLLAWNRYVRTLPRGQLYVITTYHAGQILITLGAGLHFLR